MIIAIDIDIKIDFAIYRYIDIDIVPQGEFPWMVAILDSSKQLACGGTLVDEWVVLVMKAKTLKAKTLKAIQTFSFGFQTAAHCVASYSASSLTARVGEWDATSTTDTGVYIFQSRNIHCV